jgi:hypothetical protein
MKRLLVFGLIACLLSGCALSGIFRHSVETSTVEFSKWVQLFKTRINTMPDKDIAPFVIYIITIIGDDKERLPREAEKLIDRIDDYVTGKPDDYVFTMRERAELMGAWDRIFIILAEEAGKRGMGVIQRLIATGTLTI